MNEQVETINKTVEQGVNQVSKLDELLYQLAIKGIEIVLLIVIFVILTKLLMKLNHRLMRKQAKKISETRSVTIASIIDDLIKYIMSFIGFISILPIFGVDSSIILASSGFLAIIVGVGGSSFIGDFIDGFFALFEGYYDVGDYIIAGSYEGEIVDIGLKTTVLKTFNNEIVSVPNSSIIEVVNLSKLDHIQYTSLSTAYDANLIEIEKVVNNYLIDAVKANDEIIECRYIGVDALGESSVDLRFEITSKEKDRFQAQRTFNREAKLVCDQHNIEIPFNQLVVHNG